MNLRVNPAGPLASLAVLLGLASCQTITDLDTTVGPDTDRIGVHYVELALPTQLVQIDSFGTTNWGQILVGKYQDPEIGTVTGQGYVRAALSNNNPLVKADSEFDSLIMYWDVPYVAAEREITTDQEFSIYSIQELAELNDTTDYYSNSSIPLGNLLGSGSLTIYRDIDTLYSIPMSNDLGLELLTRMKDRHPSFKNSDQFQQYYRGLSFVSSEDNEVMLGVSNGANTESRMTLYFSSPGDTISKQYDFRLSGTDTDAFHSLSTELNGSLTSSISESYQPVDAQGRILTMGGSHIHSILDLSNIRSYFDTISNSLINRADLVIDDIEDTDKNNFPVSVRFYLTENGRYIPSVYDSLLISSINPPKGIYSYTYPPVAYSADGVQYFQPTYDTAANRYLGPVTSFVQALVDSTILESNVLVVPVQNEYYVRKLKVDEGDLRIRIYYTKPNL